MEKTISISEIMKIVRTGKPILKLDYYTEQKRVMSFNSTMFCKQYFAAEFGDEIIEMPYIDCGGKKRARSINVSAIERTLRLCAGEGLTYLWIEGEQYIRRGLVIE